MSRNPYEPPREESQQEKAAKPRRLFGITVIEWLIVVALLAILVALIKPAVSEPAWKREQRRREAEKRGNT